MANILRAEETSEDLIEGNQLTAGEPMQAIEDDPRDPRIRPSRQKNNSYLTIFPGPVGALQTLTDSYELLLIRISVFPTAVRRRHSHLKNRIAAESEYLSESNFTQFIVNKIILRACGGPSHAPSQESIDYIQTVVIIHDYGC